MRTGCIKIGILVVVLAIIIYFVKNRESICNFLSSKMKNKKLLIHILIFGGAFIYVFVYVKFCMLSYKLNAPTSDQNEGLFAEADEKIEEEDEVYKELINKEYNNQNYKEPYLLEGFSYVEGTWDTGYVVQDENQNQYVWIPCSNDNIDGTVKLERCNQSASPFINYTSCYNEKYEEFLKSALENGGFYISRYEIGKEDEKPVSKSDIEVWTGITKQEAEDIISNMYENVNCEIINGYAYDATLTWLQETSNLQIENNEIEIKEGEKLISGRNITNNIYDFCDNIMEYSQEVLYDTLVIRGFMNSDSTEYTNNLFSNESRYCVLPEIKTFGQELPIVIRTVIYK